MKISLRVRGNNFPLRRRLPFACAFILTCSFVSGTACFGLPEQVKVALFDSRKPPSHLTVWGPCLVASDRSFTVPVGQYLLEVERSGEVCLRSALHRSQLLARGRSLRCGWKNLEFRLALFILFVDIKEALLFRVVQQDQAATSP